MRYFYNLVVVAFLTAAFTYSYYNNFEPNSSLKRGDKIIYVPDLESGWDGQRLADIVNSCDASFVTSQTLGYRDDAFILLENCKWPELSISFTMTVDLKNLKKK